MSKKKKARGKSTRRPAPIRVGVVGVGRGQSFARGSTEVVGMELVALCDLWEERLRQLGEELEVATYTDYDEFLEHDMDAVVLANYFHEHAPFAIRALEAGKHVMSETSANSTLAEGVALCRKVEEIEIERFQDASIRRLPFQQKIGAGLTPDQFEEKRKQGRIRHVGFSESIHLIARAMGWHLDKVEDTVSPVIAREPVSSPFLQVEAGQCAGLRQVGQGYMDGEGVIHLELQAYLGHPTPRDTVIIHGDPEIRSTIEGGVNGDIATCSMVLNALEAVQTAAPGLRTMTDIPLTHWYSR